MYPRSSWLPRPLAVACLAAALLVLSHGLPVVHATIPYYPYTCPIGSGGTDFDLGNGGEGDQGVVFWDPRNGLWFSSGQGANPAWGAWGDIPTPGDFNGDTRDDFAVFRPSTGTWLVSCSTGTNCPLGTLSVPWGTAGDIPVPADYDKDGTTDYGVWRPSNGSWYVRNGATGATLVNGLAWGQFGDCPIAARLFGAGTGQNCSGPPCAMELNVWRPSNGTWYYGRSFTGTGGAALAFGAYGDIPFAPDMGGNGDGDFVVFRPSTGTWYGLDPNFTITWGQPGDIPAPRSSLNAQNSALTVYRPTTGITYNCLSPVGSVCTGSGSPTTRGPFGSPGVVPIQGRWK